MKKIALCAFCIILFINSGFTQTVNGKPITELNVKYIRITESTISFSRKINIYLDYGQLNTRANTVVLDKDGNKMQFNSLIEVLNFFDENGYEYVHETGPSILMKKKESKEQ